jgi:hypothetical protein
MLPVLQIDLNGWANQVPLDNDTLRAFEKGNDIADDLAYKFFCVKPRRGVKITGRRWSA